MAVAGMAVPAPGPRSPSPSARNIVARLVRSRLARAVADAVMCLWLASILFHFATAAAYRIGRVACPGGSPLVAAASEVRRATLLLLLFASFVGMPLYIVLDSEYESMKAKMAPAPKRTAAEVGEMLCLSLGLLATVFFAALVVLGDLINSGSAILGLRTRTGFVISVVGILFMSTVCCFVVVPALFLRMWRIRQQLMRQHRGASGMCDVL